MQAFLPGNIWSPVQSTRAIVINHADSILKDLQLSRSSIAKMIEKALSSLQNPCISHSRINISIEKEKEMGVCFTFIYMPR